eukprot:COSAG02_NODE_15214_length_1193_cov_1.542962_3_plen_41_part_01
MWYTGQHCSSSYQNFVWFVVPELFVPIVAVALALALALALG